MLTSVVAVAQVRVCSLPQFLRRPRCVIAGLQRGPACRRRSLTVRKVQKGKPQEKKTSVGKAPAAANGKAQKPPSSAPPVSVSNQAAKAPVAEVRVARRGLRRSAWRHGLYARRRLVRGRPRGGL